MFTTEKSAIEAIDLLQNYVIENFANLPTEAREKLLGVARDRVAINVLVVGSELLYSALLQCPNMPNSDAGYMAVGSAAIHVAQGNFWGRGERAMALASYANFKLNGATGRAGQPPVPDLDDAYRIIPAPVEVETPPPPEPEPG